MTDEEKAAAKVAKRKAEREAKRAEEGGDVSENSSPEKSTEKSTETPKVLGRKRGRPPKSYYKELEKLANGGGDMINNKEKNDEATENGEDAGEGSSKEPRVKRSSTKLKESTKKSDKEEAQTSDSGMIITRL